MSVVTISEIFSYKMMSYKMFTAFDITPSYKNFKNCSAKAALI